MEYLDNDIKYVGGVGEARARLLDKELGIRTLGDMLSHYPFRYIDRTKVYRIAEITEGAPTLLQFRARITGVAYAGTGRKKRFTAYVQDPTGSAELVWFQGIKWIEKRVEVGREYLIFGRPSFYRGLLSMAHPELETMEQALSRKAESGMASIPRPRNSRTCSAPKACTRSSATHGRWSRTISRTACPKRCAPATD